jgi:hypothetical protein
MDNWDENHLLVFIVPMQESCFEKLTFFLLKICENWMVSMKEPIFGSFGNVRIRALGWWLGLV